ncbi:FKBP-type peptidyl-prolyl cis-trans isomerase [Streptomyces sp. NBC_01465]|uniref:FKBP-type peptidyl-prolyl cis-trans isomerase n=1 Tax=Streptomyces sp. NBC_01465 TaxID=2903878 RepID=UPI002E366EA9|nr:FKBP-type peptidyl-prolyl cis-trans isomerase [Streptomyces sp. NBC_01465]
MPARRRHHAPTALAALAVLAFAAAGCSDPDPQNIPKVTGAFGTRPTVQIPSFPPPKGARMKVLKDGDGAETKKGQVVVAQVDMRVWEQNRPLMDTYRLDQPTTAVLDGEHVSRTWDQALLGRKAGSRVLLVTPATHGFGPGGMAPAQVSPSDHMVLVFDVIGGYDPKQQVSGEQRPAAGDSKKGEQNGPSVTVTTGEEPKLSDWGAAPRTLGTRTLVAGQGGKIADGDTVVLQYTGFEWGKPTSFSSTYLRSGPNGFVVHGGDSMLPGWYDGLKGQRVGSRVLLTVPDDQSPHFKMTKGGVAAPPGKAAAYVFDILDRR